MKGRDTLEDDVVLRRYLMWILNSMQSLPLLILKKNVRSG